MPYHINRRGVVAPCRAKNGCPLGGSFDNRASAKEAAQEFKENYLKEEKQTSEKKSENIVQDLESKNHKQAEYGLENEPSSTTEKAYNQIQEVREKYKNEEDVKDLDEKISKLTAEKNKHTLEHEEMSVEHTKSKLENLEKGKRRMIPQDYSKYKAAYEEKLKTQEAALAKKKENMNKNSQKEYEKLNSEIQKLEKEKNYISYIKKHGEKTPIEKHHESRKAFEEKLEKKAGIHKIAMNSSNMTVGKNEIKEELVVDSKGKISNLYVEKDGEPMRVVKIHDKADGNLELENGEKITLSTSFNFKVDHNTGSVPKGFKLYTTPARGKKPYDGYKSVNVYSHDSGD